MYQKIVTIVLVMLVFTCVYLTLQNWQFRSEIRSVKDELEQLRKNAAEVAQSKTAPASPFDEPSNDPLSHLYEKEAQTTTSVRFERMSHDFGRITEGSRVKTKFKFTNTGQVVLIISGAQGSCGCTVPDWPHDPVKPGESGVIDVEFDSSGKSGETTKTVTVGANTKPASTVLTIKATVIPRDK